VRVERWMTPNPVSLRTTDSLARAIDLMKEKKIRRIPIVSDTGKLVGIVSDRDLKDVSPSRATTLDIWELHYVLDKLKLGDIMTKKPWTVTPDMPIEKAALLMLEKRVEGLPVLDAKGALVGILTEGDIFRALVELTGVARKKTRIGLLVPDKAGSIREAADICRAQGERSSRSWDLTRGCRPASASSSCAWIALPPTSCARSWRRNSKTSRSKQIKPLSGVARTRGRRTTWSTSASLTSPRRGGFFPR